LCPRENLDIFDASQQQSSGQHHLQCYSDQKPILFYVPISSDPFRNSCPYHVPDCGAAKIVKKPLANTTFSTGFFPCASEILYTSVALGIPSAFEQIFPPHYPLCRKIDKNAA
jgi:hypothetical protein